MRNLVYGGLTILILVGCSQEKASHLEVTNGRNTLRFPAVVEITTHSAICTGTFIRSNVLLTAAHCAIPTLEPQSVTDLNTATTKTVIHPNYWQNDQADIALMFFARSVADRTLPIQYSPPAKHALVTIIGFGSTEHEEEDKASSEDHIKRIGRNIIQHVGQDWISVVGTTHAHPDGEESGTGVSVSGGSGDSGGPLLNRAGEIIGVTSNTERIDRDLARTNFVPIAQYRSFIESNLANRDNYAPAPFMKLCLKRSDHPTMQILRKASGEKKNCLTVYNELAKSGSISIKNTSTDKPHFDLAMLAATLPWLNEITITGFSLANMQALVDLTQLESLVLDNVNPSDMATLSKLYSLRTLTIDSASEPNLSAIFLLPHLNALTVNGVSKKIVNPLKQTLLAGKWDRACSLAPANGNQTAIYSRSSLQYDPTQSRFTIMTKYYADANCAGTVMHSMRAQPTLDGIYPLSTSKGTYALDLKNTEDNWITIFDEKSLSPDALQTLKANCPYTIGVEAHCSWNANVVAFTIIKLDGDKLYLGDDDGQGNDGSIAEKRVTTFDTQPFLRQTAVTM